MDRTHGDYYVVSKQLVRHVSGNSVILIETGDTDDEINIYLSEDEQDQREAGNWLSNVDVAAIPALIDALKERAREYGMSEQELG